MARSTWFPTSSSDPYRTSYLPTALIAQLDGKLVVVGRLGLVSARRDPEFVDGEIALARYDPDGHLDSTFGDGGYVTTGVEGRRFGGRAAVLQPDGKFVVAGGGDLVTGRDADFVLARYDAGGVLDATFGTLGIVTTDFAGYREVALAIVRQPDGKLVAAGSTEGRLALARYDADGAVDPSFGELGQVTTELPYAWRVVDSSGNRMASS